MLNDIINGKCILRNSKDKIIIFVFEAQQFLPAKIVKIYEKSQKERLDMIFQLSKKIIDHESDLLRGSIPQIIAYDETDKYHVIFEEFIDGISMERYAERKSFFWEKDFLENLELVARWLSCFNKSFVIKKVTVPQDKIAYIFEKIKVYLEPSFLNMPAGDIEIPLGISHFDLIPRHVIRKKDKIVIIDWDKIRAGESPLLDLLEFIFCYFHSHYKFQKTGEFLEPDTVLKYLDLIYLKKSRLSDGIKEKINIYCKSLNIGDKERDFLIALWLYSLLYKHRGSALFPFLK